MLTLIIMLLSALGAGAEVILALLPVIIIIGASKFFIWLCGVLL